MSLTISEIIGKQLKGKFDRYIKISFRGVQRELSSQVYSDSTIFESSLWDISEPLSEEDFITIHLYNRNKIFHDRLVGSLHYILKDIDELQYNGIVVSDKIFDDNGNETKIELQFALKYIPPPPIINGTIDSPLYLRSNNGEVKTISFQSDINLLTNEELLCQSRESLAVRANDNLRKKIPDIPAVIPELWQIHVHIYRGKDLTGQGIDPCVDIEIDDKKESTTIQRQTNEPVWDETFVFEFHKIKKRMLNSIVSLKVYTGRGMARKGTVIGHAEFDLWSIHNEPCHHMIHKWAVLQEKESDQIKGYILLTISVLRQGDELLVESGPPSLDTPHDRMEFLLPKDSQPPREIYNYHVTLYRAESVTSPTSSTFVKKVLGGNQVELADTYVEVTFGKEKLRTKVIKGTSNPVFNQTLTFKHFFPPMFQHIRIQLCDKDSTGGDCLATHFINLNEITNAEYNGDNDESTSSSLYDGEQDIGLIPSFGPSWINFYGSTRDFENWLDMNNGYIEGNSFRGKLLVTVTCDNDESHQRDIPDSLQGKGESSMETQETFFLHSTIYDVAMINRSFAEKPISFEVTIGSCGHDLVDSDHKNRTSRPTSSSSKNSSDVTRLLKDSNESLTQLDVFSHCGPFQPEISPSRKFCHVAFGPNKPSLYLYYRQHNVTFRTYSSNMLRKILYTLEDQIFNLVTSWEYSEIDKEEKKQLLRYIMKDFVTVCELYMKKIQEFDGKIDFVLTKLDKNIYARHHGVMISLKKKIVLLFRNIHNVTFEHLVHKCESITEKMRSLLSNPYHSFPDVIIWMICGGVRTAYARIPSDEIFYSKSDFLSGEKMGCLQTVFLRSPSFQNIIQAKLQLRFWFGFAKDQSEFLINAPQGYSMENNDEKIPNLLCYDTVEKYLLRAHIYQCRSVSGSDETGLSDPFVRILFGNSVEETRIIPQTRTAVWNQMIKFNEVTIYDVLKEKGTSQDVDVKNQVPIYGDSEDVRLNPPVVVIDLFDGDADNTEEHLGRCIATPSLVGSGPYIPPKLEWLPVVVRNGHAGEILAAFDLFPPNATNIPPDPPIRKRGGKSYYSIPEGIRPKLQTYRVELLLWGIREMKRFNALKVMRPQIIGDIQYDIRLLTGDNKKHKKLRSTICSNASVNPNFENPLHIFDVDLPCEKLYMPTITLKVYEHRRFGRTGLVGTHTSKVLTDFMPNEETAKRYFGSETGFADEKLHSDEILPHANNYTNKHKIKKSKTANGTRTRNVNSFSVEADILDWWSRFYVSLYDLADEKGFEREQADDEKAIPRITIYDHELEEEFDNFNDFLQAFPIYRGKQITNQDGNKQQQKGKIKGAIRVWPQSTISQYEHVFQQPNGTFRKLPSNQTIKVLVRVYCIMEKGTSQDVDVNNQAKQLIPKDASGKFVINCDVPQEGTSQDVNVKNQADPFLVVQLGDKKISDSENHCSNTLEPEFGRTFEFEGTLPFDNLLTIQLYDWDFFPGSNDLIGETYIDIEDRYYSIHRATCGLSKVYNKVGYAAWRDGKTPTAILNELCLRDDLGKPDYDQYDVVINGKKLPRRKDETLLIDIDEPKPHSNESKALDALHSYHYFSSGCRLVPEHVETRSLYHPDKPGLTQGKLMLWVDIFPTDQVTVLPAVNISRRQPKEYELRVIIWNVEKVPLLENDILLGAPTSDIYVRGWLDGSYNEKQKTDVHYRSTDGTGLFNWRFIFPFKYHQAKKQFVYVKKLTTFSLEETEQYFPSILNLQCMEADVITSDDVIGDLKIPLSRIPPYYRHSTGWTINDYLKQDKKSHERQSLFKSRSVKGWWPFLKDGNVEQGRVELELELVSREEALLNPVGLKRDEPYALQKPNRPEESMRIFLSPLKTFELLFTNYRSKLLKIFVVVLLFLIVFLFFYSLPGSIAQKIVGAK